MRHLGEFPAGGTLDFMWATNAGSGASITRATNGNIRIYKNNSVTQRTSAAGITDTEDFDGLTGLHHLRVDLSDNTDAGFYAAGSEYFIVLEGAVIDGLTVNTVLAQFSIERANGILAILKHATYGLSALKTLIDAINTLATAIKAKTDNLPASPAAVGSAMTLTSGERSSIAVVVEQHILDDNDGQAILNAIVGAIGNQNIDQVALVAAVRSDLERNGGMMKGIKDKTDNLPADPADASDIAGAFTTVNTKLDTIDGRLDTEIPAIKAKTDLIPASPASSSDIANLLTTQMTESYAADGAAPTVARCLFMIQQSLTEFAITGTAISVKKLDGTTQAAQYTMNSATAPTSRTRSA